ncbi:DUF3558 domain-containing protein [Nocardia sp. NPDC058666]|uniref:DUF3558 domain-containing protein n=1 Tax=Nocardia sp. NPDC058666 TaxID=3346587 RepID=UPI00365C8EF6
MRNHTALGASLICGMALAACSPTTPTGSPSEADPKVAIVSPVAPAPSQPSGGRQPVAFDPCSKIDDAVPAALGFDPTTRKRGDFVFDDYAFIGCQFSRKEAVRGQPLEVGTLTISSTNITLDEMRARNYEGARPTTVNAREALFSTSRAAEACNIAFTGPDATIDVRVDSSAAFTDWVGCDHIDEAARTVEAALPSK